MLHIKMYIYLNYCGFRIFYLICVNTIKCLKITNIIGIFVYTKYAILLNPNNFIN